MEYIKELFSLDNFKKDKVNWLLFVGLVVVIPFLIKKNEDAHSLMRADFTKSKEEHERACGEMKAILKENLIQYREELTGAIDIMRVKDSIIIVQNERLRTQKRITN